MKTLLAALAICLISLTVSAQEKTTKAPKASQSSKQKPAAPAVIYRCPTCGYTSEKPGDCPKDHIALVKVGDYYCPDCYMTSSKPGKCTMCGVDMKKMEAPTTAKK
jgi:hypothetical protein